MRLCQFDENRLGLVENETVRDVTSVLDKLPGRRYPFPQGDALIAVLPSLRDAIMTAARSAPAKRLSDVRLLSPVANPSKVMGAEGDPPLALRRSIDKGMAPNSAGRHVNYLQIYVGDVLPADMQPVLKYAASLFHRP